jgi:hypothetical protein
LLRVVAEDPGFVLVQPGERWETAWDVQVLFIELVAWEGLLVSING